MKLNAAGYYRCLLLALVLLGAGFSSTAYAADPLSTSAGLALPTPTLAEGSYLDLSDPGEFTQATVPSFSSYAGGSGLEMQHPGDSDGSDVVFQDLTPSLGLSGALVALHADPKTVLETVAKGPKPSSAQGAAATALLVGVVLIAGSGEDTQQLDPATEAQRAARRAAQAWEFELEHRRELGAPGGLGSTFLYTTLTEAESEERSRLGAEEIARQLEEEQCRRLGVMCVREVTREPDPSCAGSASYECLRYSQPDTVASTKGPRNDGTGPQRDDQEPPEAPAGTNWDDIERLRALANKFRVRAGLYEQTRDAPLPLLGDRWAWSLLRRRHPEDADFFSRWEFRLMTHPLRNVEVQARVSEAEQIRLRLLAQADALESKAEGLARLRHEEALRAASKAEEQRRAFGAETSARRERERASAEREERIQTWAATHLLQEGYGGVSVCHMYDECTAPPPEDGDWNYDSNAIDYGPRESYGVLDWIWESQRPVTVRDADIALGNGDISPDDYVSLIPVDLLPPHLRADRLREYAMPGPDYSADAEDLLLQLAEEVADSVLLGGAAEVDLPESELEDHINLIEGIYEGLLSSNYSELPLEVQDYIMGSHAVRP